MSLALISMPSKYREITIMRMIKCAQTQSSCTSMEKYKTNEASRWSSRSQSLAELNQSTINDDDKIPYNRLSQKL